MATKVKPSRLNVSGTPQAGQVPVYVDEDSFQRGPNGTGDVVGPSSSTDGDIVLFDGVTGKKIKDSSKKLSDYQEALTTQTAYTSKGTSTKVPTITTNTLGQVTNITETNIAFPVTSVNGYTGAVILDADDISDSNTTNKFVTTQTAYTSKGSSSKVPQITTNTLGQVTGITEVNISYPSQVSDTAYGSGWDGQTTTAPSQNVVYDKIKTIDDIIPSAATSSNKLTDKNYVDDSINSVTAYYITKDANGDQFATYAELAAAITFYSGGVARVPTRNDYTIVLADENHDNATTRYIYNSGWEYQYTVNETALSQAQLDALNSGITSGKVSTYDGYASTISGKQDALTLPATPTQGHLVTWGANNKSLTDGGEIPTVPTDVSAFNNDVGYLTSATGVTSVNGSAGAVTGLQTTANLKTGLSDNSDSYYPSQKAVKTAVDAKQDSLATQTAYTSKGTATKVPTITTNTLGQVTAISETNITFPVTSVNSNTGAVTVSEFLPGGTATTGYVVKKTANGYEWAAESGAVTSVNGNTGAVTVSEFTPSGTATTGYVVTKTAGGYEWAAPSGGGDVQISSQANNILTSGAKIWAGTQANYESLGTYDNNTVYLTI